MAAPFAIWSGYVSRPWGPALLAAAAVAGFWLTASVVVSHCIYDRSGIATGKWLEDVLPGGRRTIGNFHAGLDESSGFIARSYPAAGLRNFDFHDAAVMGARSIERARRLSAGVADAAAYDRLPPADRELDAEFVIFSAHELRRPEHRLAFFRELRRCLSPDGSVVVAEHLRDGWNFLAFGPGALHFLPRSAWEAAFSGAGLAVRGEFRVTPFVTIFVLGGAP
jgi:SAM-dependent methyltransferase